MLSTVLIQSVILASGGILSVGSILIVILLLISEQNWRSGLAYMLGYVGTYAIIGLTAVWLGQTATESNAGEPSTFVPILLIVLSILLLWLAQRNWRTPVSEESENPRLFAMLDNITPTKSFLFGAVVTIFNVKNLAIFLSAISIVIVSSLSFPIKMGIVLLDVVVFCLSVIMPVLIYISFPQTAYSRLNQLKQTLENNRRPIGIWVPLIFGLLFLTQGITRLL